MSAYCTQQTSLRRKEYIPIRSSDQSFSSFSVFVNTMHKVTISEVLPDQTYMLPWGKYSGTVGFSLGNSFPFWDDSLVVQHMQALPSQQDLPSLPGPLLTRLLRCSPKPEPGHSSLKSSSSFSQCFRGKFSLRSFSTYMNCCAKKAVQRQTQVLSCPVLVCIIWVLWHITKSM